MRIFFIATKLNFTKGGSMVENDLTARTLQGLGNEVTMLTVFSELNDFSQSPPAYRIIEERIKNKRQLTILWNTVWFMRAYSDQADIFYIEGQTFFYGAGLYRWLGGKRPVVAFFVREQVSWQENISALFWRNDTLGLARTFYSLKRTIRWYIERYIFIHFANFVDFFTWGSPLLRREYEDFGLVTEGKSMIIGDPYPWDEVMKKYGVMEHSYANRTEKKDILTILYSARMAPGKGFDVLLQAFSRIKNKNRFRLVLGGDGPERPLIEGMIKDLGLEYFVSVTGWIPKVDFHKSLMGADIFIYPRWRTAQPALGLSEAMAFGIPSIVPENTGLHWVAGGGALTFKLDDSGDLAEKIETLGNNKEMRIMLSKKCHERLLKPDVNYRLTMPAIYEAMEKLIKPL